MLKREFIETPKGRRSRHRARYRRRLRLEITGLEPRAKRAMGDEEKRAFQLSVISQMIQLKRRAFRGPLVLQISVTTTDRTPPHVQTIAKNLLDLLAAPVDKALPKKAVLYFDDRQIQGLSVTCAHGGDTPRIALVATAFRDFLEDLDLALFAHEELAHNEYRHEEEVDDELVILRDLLRTEKHIRALYGDKTYENLVGHAREESQRYVLGESRVSVTDLARLYGLTGAPYSIRHALPTEDLLERWEALFRETPFRIVLSELPHAPGTSAAYHAEAEKAFRAFQQRFERILRPLRTPVALVVVMKPAPRHRERGQHDLDNVLRDYLIPNVLRVFEPPSHHAWVEASRPPTVTRFDPLSPFTERVLTLPASTRLGVIRYEAWRLLRSAGDDSPGFVSVALVPDYLGWGDLFTRIDGTIGSWEETID